MTPASPDRAADDSRTASTGPESEQKTAGRPPGAQRSGKPAVAEIGGPKGPEPTRYGDWETGGRCSDF